MIGLFIFQKDRDFLIDSVIAGVSKRDNLSTVNCPIELHHFIIPYVTKNNVFF